MTKLTLDDAFFKVQATELVFPDSELSTGVYGLRRTDTGALLGTASNRYGITQNYDLIEVAELGFHKCGLTDYDHSVNLVRNGARTFITYDFKGTDTQVAITKRKGDVMGLRMTLVNSFDGSLRRSIRLGLLRLVCTNGMVGLRQEFALEHRHTTGNVEIDRDLVFDAIAKAKEGFSTLVDRYRKLVGVKISTDLGEAILNYMVQKKMVGVRISEKVNEIWRNPTFKEDKPRNLYTFINAWTQHLDSPYSDYGQTHYETAEKTKQKVFDFVYRVSNHPEKLNGLMDASIEAESVVLD